MAAPSISRTGHDCNASHSCHPEKAHRPDNPVLMRKPDWIRVKAPTSNALCRDQGADAQIRPAHGVRRGGLPEYRRVLEAEARDVDDPGRRPAPAPARSATSRPAGPISSIRMSRHHVAEAVRSSASSTWWSPRSIATICRRRGGPFRPAASAASARRRPAPRSRC